MSTLSIADYNSRILEKFFSQNRTEDHKSNFKKFNSVIRFVFHLKERNLINDVQLADLVKHSCSIYLEKELDRRIWKSISKGLSALFSSDTITIRDFEEGIW